MAPGQPAPSVLNGSAAMAALTGAPSSGKKPATGPPKNPGGGTPAARRIGGRRLTPVRLIPAARGRHARAHGGGKLGRMAPTNWRAPLADFDIDSAGQRASVDKAAARAPARTERGARPR